LAEWIERKRSLGEEREWRWTVRRRGGEPNALLLGRFGGGPAVSHLYQCETCQHEMDTLKRRQRSEMEMFVEVRRSC
jgi:hypothetical protein